MDHLLGRSEVFAAQKLTNSFDIPCLSAQQTGALMQLSRLPGFKNVVSKVTGNGNIANWIASDNAELNIPVIWDNDETLSSFFTLK